MPQRCPRASISTPNCGSALADGGCECVELRIWSRVSLRKSSSARPAWGKDWNEDRGNSENTYWPDLHTSEDDQAVQNQTASVELQRAAQSQTPVEIRPPWTSCQSALWAGLMSFPVYMNHRCRVLFCSWHGGKPIAEIRNIQREHISLFEGGFCNYSKASSSNWENLLDFVGTFVRIRYHLYLCL